MAKLSRAALGTAVGRDYARRGWQISQTGAKPAGGGAYERMGGLDYLEGARRASQAGIRPGDPSWFTNPFRGLPGVGESAAAGRQMSMRTGGGRSARTGESTFQPGGGSFDTGDMEFDAAGYQAAIEAQNKAAQGGATFTGVPDKRQFWRKRRSSNVVPFRPGAAPQGPLQRDAMNRILFGR